MSTARPLRRQSRRCSCARRTTGASALIPLSGIEPERAVEAGYALVCQDVRGLHGSDGEFYTFSREGRGRLRLGRVGRSPGVVRRRGRHGRSLVRCDLPVAGRLGAAAAPAGDLPRRHRERLLSAAGSTRAARSSSASTSTGLDDERPARRCDAQRSSSATCPLRTVPLPDPTWAGSTSTGSTIRSTTAYWRELAINRRYPRIDGAGAERGRLVRRLPRRHPGELRSDEPRGRVGARPLEGQQLLVGPWAHGTTYGLFPDHAFDLFAPQDAVDFTERQLLFFDRHLRDARPAAPTPRPSALRHGRQPLAGGGGLAARARPRDALASARGRRPLRGAAGRRGPRLLRLRPERPGADDRRPHLAAAAADEGERRAARPEAARAARRTCSSTRRRRSTRPARGHRAADGLPVRRDDAADTDFVVEAHATSGRTARSRILAEGVIRCRFRDGARRAASARARRRPRRTRSTSSRPRTSSRPATGSGSSSRAARSRASTEPELGSTTSPPTRPATCGRRGRRSSTMRRARSSCAPARRAER